MTKSNKPAKPTSSTASRWLLPAVGLAVVGVAILAIVLNWSSAASPGGSAAATVAASPVASGSTEPASAAPAGPPVITGAALPTFTGTQPDPAKGLVAPVVDGHDYAGQPVSIAPSGRTTMVIFAAHWCPHCQREIPLLQAWVNAGGLPDDVDIVTVSTGIDPTRPNYPPEDWFAREGWTAPVIVDPTDSVATAYGLSGYPFFVILDGAGNVFARAGGEIPTDALEQVLGTVPRG